LVFTDAMAVIANLEGKMAAVLGQNDAHSMDAGAPGDIGQGLLEDAKQRGGALRVDGPIVSFR
jgi:hypothetical protein